MLAGKPLHLADILSVKQHKIAASLKGYAHSLNSAQFPVLSTFYSKQEPSNPNCLNLFNARCEAL